MSTLDPSIKTYDSCACGCGCEPDGDWHWSQQPWCRCVANRCSCVTDRLARGFRQLRSGKTRGMLWTILVVVLIIAVILFILSRTRGTRGGL